MYAMEIINSLCHKCNVVNEILKLVHAFATIQIPLAYNAIHKFANLCMYPMPQNYSNPQL
jgi:hypothetical protein